MLPERVSWELVLFWVIPVTNGPIMELMVVLEAVVLVVVPLLVMLPVKFSVVPLKVMAELFEPFAALLWMVRFPVPLTPPVDEMVLPKELLEKMVRLLPRVIAPW